MADERQRWTPEELLTELRARERARVARAAEPPSALPGTRAAAPAESVNVARGVAPRFRNLSDLSSAEIARLLNNHQRAIYGTDDRKDVYAVSNARAMPLIEASLALVEANDLQKTADGWSLRTTLFQKKYQLCSSEPFALQPLGCFCSGVLVAPDVIATAGHCVKSAADLSHIRFVFGFRMLAKDKPRTIFPADDVYEGRAVIGREYTADQTDWALVRLDRPVVGRQPVPFRSGGRIQDDDPVFVVGHPCGLPQKFAGGARVRNNAPASHFAASLDTYGGNSGSGVFSASRYELEGLLVRGQTDFVSTGTCYVSQVYPSTGAGGEDVTRSTEFASLVAARPASAAKSVGKSAVPAGGTSKAAATRERVAKGAPKRAPTKRASTKRASTTRTSRRG